MTKALVVFSGGQDSTTCLGIAQSLGYEVHAIGFNYGQRHAVELEQAAKIAEQLGIPFTVVDIREFGKLVSPGTALVGEGDVNADSPLAQFQGDNAVHASFVPNRNATMLTIAHGFAQLLGAPIIYTGVCETDYSGYPDCREVFIRSLEASLNCGYESNIHIATPLMHKTKGETFKLAQETGVLDLVINESHTCYEGVRVTTEDRYEWGHGCGKCPACKLRAKGWADYKAMTTIGQL